MHSTGGNVASWTPLAAVACIIVLLIFSRLKASPLRALPLPPGPPVPRWISGHFSILPATQVWKTYTEWATRFGSVIHLRLYHQHIIVLSSRDDCVELFEKRSNLYTDKPTFIMLDLMGWDFNVGVMPYGPRWRRHRRIFQQHFKKTASVSYRPEQTRKVIDMLHGLLSSPEDFRDHVQTVTAAVAMSTAYGYNIQPKKDYFVSLAEDANSRLAFMVLPGAALINSFPIMRHLPSWFPGAGFKRIAAESKELTKQLREVPFKWAEGRIAAGMSSDCLVASLLPLCKTQDDKAVVQEVAAVVYVAGADTTATALETFFYAMAISDDVQRKAQAEIDTIVGRNRLPDYDDWPSLPYTEALVREIFRWRPPTPVIPGRRSSEDDVFKGYLIPNEAILMINIWAMTRDADKYKHPEEFIPDRFIDENGQLNDEDMEFVFGFGRRSCPGRHMARATLWLSVVTTLWAFKISKAKDESGNEIPISGEYTDGAISRPLRHACSIVPRFSEVGKIIKEASFHTEDTSA